MTKEQVIEHIISVCQSLKLDTHTKYRTERWNADVLVNHGTYKVAFNICKCPGDVESIRNAMREQRVCGCWLMVPSRKNVNISNGLPCFKLTEKSDGIHTILNSELDKDDANVVRLDAFIPSWIERKIKFAKNMAVKYMDIRFFEKKCWNWKCKKNSHIYFINRLFSEDGISIPGENDALLFNPFVVKAVTQYIKEHPELKITMGEIKPRFSKIAGETYSSFGCAFCDNIFGQWYVDGDISEMRYYANELPKAIIKIQENITVQANIWYRTIIS